MEKWRHLSTLSATTGTEKNRGSNHLLVPRLPEMTIQSFPIAIYKLSGFACLEAVCDVCIVNQTTNMKKPTLNIKSGGFSLVELLVVIAVIAIIAAIAIPNIANITEAAGGARDQRNAQNIASVYSAAIAAGAVAPANKAARIAAVIDPDGLTSDLAPFRDQSFSAPMNEEEAERASLFLTNDLQYIADGGQTEVPSADILAAAPTGGPAPEPTPE